MAVSFVPEENTSQKKGKTHTLMDDNLKTLYLRVILDDREIEQPVVHSEFFITSPKNLIQGGIDTSIYLLILNTMSIEYLQISNS